MLQRATPCAQLLHGKQSRHPDPLIHKAAGPTPFQPNNNLSAKTEKAEVEEPNQRLSVAHFRAILGLACRGRRCPADLADSKCRIATASFILDKFKTEGFRSIASTFGANRPLDPESLPPSAVSGISSNRDLKL